MEDVFARADIGYDPDQVSLFLERARASYQGLPDPVHGQVVTLTTDSVRAATFDLVKNGFEVNAVDQSLDRLEDALARRQGVEPSERRIQALASIVQRPSGARFPRPAPGTPGYTAREVDALIDRFGPVLFGQARMAPADIRRAAFTQSKRKASYDEGAVDRFLAIATDYLRAQLWLNDTHLVSAQGQTPTRAGTPARH